MSIELTGAESCIVHSTNSTPLGTSPSASRNSPPGKLTSIRVAVTVRIYQLGQHENLVGRCTGRSDDQVMSYLKSLIHVDTEHIGANNWHRRERTKVA